MHELPIYNAEINQLVYIVVTTLATVEVVTEKKDTALNSI